MNDTSPSEDAGSLRDRLDGLEFSLKRARFLAAISPERVDLEERIEQIEAEIQELKVRLRSQGDASDADAG